MYNFKVRIPLPTLLKSLSINPLFLYHINDESLNYILPLLTSQPQGINLLDQSLLKSFCFCKISPEILALILLNITRKFEGVEFLHNNPYLINRIDSKTLNAFSYIEPTQATSPILCLSSYTSGQKIPDYLESSRIIKHGRVMNPIF